MPTWTTSEDKQLAELIRQNRITVNQTTEADRKYLWEVNQKHFPDYCGQGTSGKENAIRRMRKKFRQWNLNQTLVNARRGTEGGK